MFIITLNSGQLNSLSRTVVAAINNTRSRQYKIDLIEVLLKLLDKLLNEAIIDKDIKYEEMISSEMDRWVDMLEEEKKLLEEDLKVE